MSVLGPWRKPEEGEVHALMTVILHPVIRQVPHHQMRSLTSHWMDYSYRKNKKENSLNIKENACHYLILW